MKPTKNVKMRAKLQVDLVLAEHEGRLEEIANGFIRFKRGVDYDVALQSYETKYDGFQAHSRGLISTFDCPYKHIRNLANEEDVLTLEGSSILHHEKK